MDTWTEKHFALFWGRMIGIYGRRFAEEHGSEINPTWRETIGAMSFERISKTLDICLNAGDAHPVTLSLFIKRSKSFRLDLPGELDLLPSPNFTPEKLAENQQRIKEIIRDAAHRIAAEPPKQNNIETNRQKAMEYTGVE